MLKTETKTERTNEKLFVAFQNFNGVFIAKITNQKGKETFAYGNTKCVAEENAVKNYSKKYNTTLFPLLL